MCNYVFVINFKILKKKKRVMEITYLNVFSY